MATKRKQKRTTKRRRKGAKRRRPRNNIALAALNVGMTVKEFKRYVKLAGAAPNPGKFTRRSNYTPGWD